MKFTNWLAVTLCLIIGTITMIMASCVCQRRIDTHDQSHQMVQDETHIVHVGVHNEQTRLLRAHIQAGELMDTMQNAEADKRVKQQVKLQVDIYNAQAEIDAGQNDFYSKAIEQLSNDIILLGARIDDIE